MPTKGIKYDGGKLRYDLLPMGEIDDLVSVLTYGSLKYCDNGWQGVGIERYKAALLRHISKAMQGEDCDEESGLDHLAHAMCNCLFLLHLKKHKEEDD